MMNLPRRGRQHGLFMKLHVLLYHAKTPPAIGSSLTGLTGFSRLCADAFLVTAKKNKRNPINNPENPVNPVQKTKAPGLD
jgi:hypothetical protein